MLSEEVLDKVVERLTNRIEQGNEYILTKIGKKIDEIGKLKPSEAQQLEQMIRYGGDYQKILNKLAEITKMNKKDIEKIFQEVAKQDQQFAEKFYNYRGKNFIPYNKNAPLRKQVDALAKLTSKSYEEFARSKAIGFSVRNDKGDIVFKGLKQTYNEVIDRAILNVAQGKTTYQEEMYKILKNIGESGVITLDYEGRTMRLDSAVRMHMKDSLRQLHNEMQMQFGEEFDADGVEISVHLNPAPDHEEVQGRQFSITEFNKFQSDEDAVSYDGIEFTADFEGHDRRSISQYNCYHKIFPIILGVSEPEYSNEELQQIIDDNHKGFKLDGKQYTNYEGTQLQRRLETEIRKQKDLQILGRTSGNEKLANESQLKINLLTKKYKELSKASGLPTYTERMRVSGYRPIKVENIVQKTTSTRVENIKDAQLPSSISENADLFTREEMFNMYVGDLSDKNVEVDSSIMLVDEDIRNRQLEHLNELTDKYPLYANKKPLTIVCGPTKANWVGSANYKDKKITLHNKYYTDKQKLLDTEKHMIETKWSYYTDEKNYDIYTLTHEYGHQVEYDYLRYTKDKYDSVGRRFNFKQADKDLRDTLISRAKSISGEKLNTTEFKNKYFSGYSKSKQNYEWFAELFAQLELGEETPFTQALKEWLEVYYK